MNVAYRCESYEKALAGIPTGATCVGCYKALTLTCSKCHIPSQSTKSSGVKRKSASEAKNTRLKGSGQAPRGCILAKTDSNKLGSNTKKHAKQTNGRRRRFSDSGNSEGGGDTFDDDGVISDDFAGHSSDLEGTESHSNAKEEPKLQVFIYMLLWKWQEEGEGFCICLCTCMHCVFILFLPSKVHFL